MAIDEPLACCRTETCCGLRGCNSLQRRTRCCGMDFVYVDLHREPKLTELLVVAQFMHYTRDSNKELREKQHYAKITAPKVTLQAYVAAIEQRDELDRLKAEEEEQDLDDFLKMEF